MHGTLDGASIEEKQYNSITRKLLQEKKFDYVAMGHIHKPDYHTNIAYPGSTISLGFDELGEHGMLVGEIEKNKLQLEFVPLDEEEFKEIELEVDAILAKEDLIEKINQLEIKKNQYIKIILKGNRNFEINPYDIMKYIENERIIKIKNHTKIAYDLEKMANENTLKGLFVKEMLEKIKQESSEEEKEILEKAIEIGLEALE